MEVILHPKRPQWGYGVITNKHDDGKWDIEFFQIKEKKTIDTNVVDLDIIKDLEKLKEIKKLAPKRLHSTNKSKSITYKDLNISISQLISVFLKQFEKGFSDEEFIKEERVYKLQACDYFKNALNKDEFHQLMDKEDYNEITIRALRAVAKTNFIFSIEKAKFRGALKTEENIKNFSLNLYELLYSEGDFSKRFESFTGCLETMECNKWTLSTYFLFLSDQEKHAFLKPATSKIIANIFNKDIKYHSKPNVETYKAYLDLVDDLKGKISHLEPIDGIDVQSFIWCSVREVEKIMKKEQKRNNPDS